MIHVENPDGIDQGAKGEMLDGQILANGFILWLKDGCKIPGVGTEGAERKNK